jgi:hypothetical protein
MGTVSLPTDSVPHAAFARWLRELPDYVVLRNQDVFGNLHRGGDVDLLVADIGAAERALIRHLGPPVRTIRSSYVSGYSYDWGHVDLLPTIEWRGACFLPTGAVLESRRRSPDGLPVPQAAHEAVISWLTNLLFGGSFKERYAAEIREAVESDGRALRQTLSDVAGEHWGARLWQAAVDGRAEVSAKWTRSLRRSVWWRAFRRTPIHTLQRFVAFVTEELRLRFTPPVPWIAILGSRNGPSLMNEVDRRFADCRYASIKTFHWHPRLGARAHAFAPVEHANEAGQSAANISGWRLVALAAEWWVVYWTRLVHLRAKGYVVAIDRMSFDQVGDRHGRPDGTSLLARVLLRLLPKPDLVFMLDSEPEVSWQGGNGVPVRVLDGRSPVRAWVDEIQGAVRAWMVKRSVAILGQVQALMSSVR